MAKQGFNAEHVRQAIHLYDQGLNLSEVSRRLGRPRTTVDGWIRKHADGSLKIVEDGVWWGDTFHAIGKGQPPAQQPEQPEQPDGQRVDWGQEAQQFIQSARHSPAVKEQAGLPDRPDVRPEWDGVAANDAAELWAKAEANNERQVQKAIHRSKFDVNLGSDPVGICFVSDQHISAINSVCLRRMREDAELIAESDGLFACCGGDGVDNHVKHRSALLAARSTPGDQWLLYEYYLGLFAHKIIAMISGNHDAWTQGFAGIDMVQWIADKNRICYAPAEAHLNLTLGGQKYLISFRHQYRMNSTFNETHAVKQWLRHGDTPFDVGCVCHHHTPAMEECLIMGEHRIFCRPGSYQITSAHSRQYGYNLTTPTCPTVVFYPDERKMVGFYSVKAAAKWLRMELGK